METPRGVYTVTNVGGKPLLGKGHKYHSPKKPTPLLCSILALLYCKFVLFVITTTATRFGRRFIHSIEFLAMAASIRLQAVIVVVAAVPVLFVVLAYVLSIIHPPCYYYYYYY